MSQEDEAQHHTNLVFKDMEQQDQLIMSWILASISYTFLSHLMKCETSAQVWRILDLYFAMC